MTVQDKFLKGKDLTNKELLKLPIVDRCRHVVKKYFKNGFSAGEVTAKLNELHPDGDVDHYTPMEVYNALESFYGRP